MTKTLAEKPYHHGDLRKSLLDAACRHLVEFGAETLSLRALAREVGVSQTAPYRHFDSKGALFAAIATDSFGIMREDLIIAASLNPDDIRASIVEVGLAYVRFAEKYPERYQLIFDSRLVDFKDNEELMAAGTAAFDVVIEILERGVKQGVLVDRPVLEMAGMLWAGIHGVAGLILKNAHVPDEAPETPSKLVMCSLSQDPRITLEMFVDALMR